MVNVTEHNIAVIYEYFCNNVVKDVKSIQPNDLVALFINAVTDHDTCFVHPKKANVLICNSKEYTIYPNAYNSFFSYFNKNYTPQEKSNFSKISDRLIEDTNRRNKGEFYTPTLFVDKAHRMIESALGEDWKEKYVVWDNCCGTKNLTRDYRFNELYCSTLEQGELDQCTDYNKEAVSFQFDFLNDSLDKLPKGLLDALKANKPFVFFLNPPYATAGNKGEKSKKDVAKTLINKEMKADKMGACSANLYAQFLYRILKIKKQFNLTNCHIALFSPTLFLTGVSWAKFRTAYLNEFAFDNGVQFKASHFADVSDKWGISFSLWHNGETADKNNFNYILVDKVEGEIVETEKKTLYNTDNTDSISSWYNVDAPKTRDFVTLKSALNFGNKTLKTPDHFIGYYVSGSNIVEKNAQECRIQNAPNDGGKENTVILPENFDKVVSLFAARKLITCDWKNSKDEYLIPNTDSPLWNEFVNDSIIYSLFNTSSNQSSLPRGVKNEFFWRSAAEMAEKANACGNDETTDKNNFNYILVDNIEGEIKEIGIKDVYNTDGLLTASNWVTEPIKHLKREDAPQFSSAIKCKEKGYGTIVKGCFGSFVNNANSVDSNTQGVTILSSAYSGFANVSILPDNFDRCAALFAARKLIEKNWVNSNDEYLAPNTEHTAYNEFVNDSLIYSLFHSSSNQSSLRNVEYKEKLWNIKNEFFWRSAAEMAEKANACGNDEMYNDARVSNDRYVYNKLQGIELSSEAQAVLDKANEILDITMRRRKVFDAEHPEYQVNNWDCGWYQIKAMATKEERKEFKVVFDKLADKMRPIVYELGFLKKNCEKVKIPIIK